MNFDGVRQPQETPFENVALWIDPKRKAVTDANGYYRFKSVRGQSASVRLDTDTIPEGYIPTVPAVIAVSLEGNRTMRVDFGIAARSEISGFIFEDIDGNGTLSSKDKGISGVAVILDDGTRSFTDDSGRYVFSQASPGVHTVSIDLTTLPVEYLPAVPVKQDITLQEGTTYYLSFPIRKQ